jgi:3-dehydroquinate synthetase
MVAAAEISVRKAGLSEAERAQIVRTLEAFELPTRLPTNFPRQKIQGAIRFDKKFTGAQVRFVVLPRIGSAHVATDVTIADLETALALL